MGTRRARATGDGRIDGRVARGRRRRAEILEATLAVVERDGVAGVSHRAVAVELGLSPSATTYYFATLDDLLTAALVSANAWSEAAFESVTSVDELAAQLSMQMINHRRRLIAAYELYLLAARRPALRAAARRWIESVQRLARRLGGDEQGAQALVIAIDGLGLGALLDDSDTPVEEIADILQRALAPLSRR